MALLRRCVVLLVALLLLSAHAEAQPAAEPPAGDEPTSDQPTSEQDDGETPSAYQLHMANGVKLFKEQNWDGAVAEFEAAYAAEPKASPLINLALTYKKLANPAKAIEVLERALGEHADSIGDQRAAAEREIREMRALLAWVTVEVVPPGAKLHIDDRPQPEGTAGRPIPLSPGTRSFRAEAPGFAPREVQVKLVSGHDNGPVKLSLEAITGTVTVTAREPEAWIEVDSNKVAQHSWTGTLPPGVHAVRVLYDDEAQAIQIVVQAGGKHVVTQADDGTLESAAAAPTEGGKDDDWKDELPKILRGFYGTGAGGFLAAFVQATHFTPDPADRFGAAVGLHLGYRVADWAGFEVMGQFSDIRVSGQTDVPVAQGGGEVQTTKGVTMVLKSLRLGGMLRVMLPGRSTVRFVGTAGAGAVIESVDWRDAPITAGIYGDQSGVGGFGEIDFGVEIELSNILLDLMVQNTLQSTKHFDLDNDKNAFETRPILIAGPALRIGYGLW